MTDQNLHHHPMLDQPSAAAAAAVAAAQVAAQQAQQPTPQQMHAHQQLQAQQLQLLQNFWSSTMTEIEGGVFDFKVHQLPLARIKKVMKADEDVKLITHPSLPLVPTPSIPFPPRPADDQRGGGSVFAVKPVSRSRQFSAPILFAKGCDIFITELTMRAWIHAEENKRRTLQRSDIATAITKTDMFDFLIDIVPREEVPRLPPMKSEKVEGQEMDYRGVAGVDQHGYPYGYTIPQGQYAAAVRDTAVVHALPADQRISAAMDPMLAYQQQQQAQAALQQQQQVQFMRQQLLQQQLIQQQAAQQTQGQPGGSATQPGPAAADLQQQQQQQQHYDHAATQYYQHQQYAQVQAQAGQAGAAIAGGQPAAATGAAQRAAQQYQ
ncbi:histone-fold-containing protein [Jimgerdemannia flammicorona]|uniref:Histone-fold-containing protein n=1 Tax=Jimgerdemannia flammicorona TaxID=994334 RepID=A0A433QDS8_9FUNG|nr:histone-fold-containing protein [Jimgerdemannia flammicorona]